MDLHVIEARINVTKRKIGDVLVRYHGLGLYLDICLYKDQNLWIRMPEIWMSATHKKKFVFWYEKSESDECQRFILNKVFDMLGLDLDRAIKEREDFFAKKKELTKVENKLTLSKHNSEEKSSE